MPDKNKKLQNILDKAVDNKKTFGTSFCIHHQSNDWCGESGNLKKDCQYFIASTTKLFVTAIILNFDSNGILNIEDKVHQYFDPGFLFGLLNINGKDYSREISIKNLLAHTSGIPDYFQQKDKNQASFENRIKKGQDQSWSFGEIIDYNRTLSPLFVPGTNGKAHYSDTNFQLLGKIIENITGKPISEILKELIFDPLGLNNTYLYRDITDRKPINFYYKDKELFIPKAMASFGPDGGMVSTSKELMVFLMAFFNGKLFPKSYIDKIMVWNPIFFPLQAGVGIQQFKLHWILNPMGTIPALIGHSGLSGALAFYSPEKDLFITGTVNQVAYPDTSFRLAIKLIQACLKNP